MISKLLLTLLVFFSAPAVAKVRTVATTPEAAWLLHQVGGNLIEVKTLARSGDNYHFLDARPDFILAINRAEILCRMGAELEVGWLPKAMERAANNKVKTGASGDCDLSQAVALLEKPEKPVSRAMGDVHAAGNPHFWFSPLEIAKAAVVVEKKLTEARPDQAATFAGNRKKVEERLNALHTELMERLKPLQKRKLIQFHRDFSYFFSAYNLTSIGSIEEVSGVSPSAARLGRVAIEAKQENVALALAALYDSKSALAKFSELSGVPVVQVSTSIKNPEQADAYLDWQRSLADSILKAVQ